MLVFWTCGLCEVQENKKLWNFLTCWKQEQRKRQSVLKCSVKGVRAMVHVQAQKNTSYPPVSSWQQQPLASEKGRYFNVSSPWARLESQTASWAAPVDDVADHSRQLLQRKHTLTDFKLSSSNSIEN